LSKDKNKSGVTSPQGDALLKVCITIDIEDWFQLIFYKNERPLKEWSREKLTIEEPLSFLLDTFERERVCATFFVLGWYGKYYPDLIRSIQDRGHEIASHGMTHVLNSNLEDGQQEYELSASKEILEKVTGEKILGYRAPSFSISKNVALKLISVGYKYDSSFFPFNHNSRYGCLTELEIEELSAEGLKEIPISVASVGRITVPFAGGRYFRLFPELLVEKLIGKTAQKPLVFYFHPWEFSQNNKYLRSLPFLSEMRALLSLRNLGVRKNRGKFINLVNYLKKNDYEFTAMRNLL